MEPIRITEVLGYFAEPWKLEWYGKKGKAHCNKIGKAAMKIGSRVDEIIKNGERPTAKDAPEVHNCIAAFNKWKEIYKPIIIPCSRINIELYGQEISGEPDLNIEGTLTDIKCSSKISPSYWVQDTMYTFMNTFIMAPELTEEAKVRWTHDTCKDFKVAILRLDKVTGSFEYVVKDYDASLVDVWVGLMRAMVYYKGEQGNGDEL